MSERIDVTTYAMPKPGEVVVGKYRLDKVAGEGGMGIVYAAEHLVLKQRVAVKVLLPDAASSEAMVERFAREARAAAKINSEHVARVLDAGTLTSSGAPFLVMEYLEGCDLEELLDLQDALPVQEIVDYLVQALEGLAHAHASGIVHRDLKPANLFLACRPDGTNAIKLLDFGISKTTKHLSHEDKRLTGHHVLGSPVYMSPEQLRNSPDIDPRADLWSIGIVAYEMLSGAPPFDGAGVGEIFAAILEKSPVPLHEKNPKISEGLANVIGKCLRREPDERWADAGELARALAPFGSDPDTEVATRAEQVLARARLVSVSKTPVEARRVVDAIDAAAEQAMKTMHGDHGRNRMTSPVLPLSKRKGAGGRTLRGGLRGKIARFARQSPERAAGAGLFLAALLALCIVGAVKATRASSAAVPSSANNNNNAPAAAIANAAPPTTAGAPAASEQAAVDPPLVMDLPPSANGAAAPMVRRGAGASPHGGGPATKPGATPQRPKFLNTRE